MFPIGRRPARRPFALFLCLAALAAGTLAPAAYAGGDRVKIKPSGGDDTDAIRDAIELAGPDGVVELGAGTFRISESIIVRHSLTIKGAGRDQTEVIADASLAPDGAYPNISEEERASLEMEFAVPFAFVFHVQEERFGRYALRDLTLGMSGLTAPHYDWNADAETERLFSLAWVQGFDGAWLNSAGQSPTEIGEIDAEHRVLSTVRFRCENVFFDGKNRDSSAPDVWNGFGMEGGFVYSHDENGEEVIDWLIKPMNGNISFKKCRFTDFGGPSGAGPGILPQLVIGRDDPSWTFGPEAVEGAIIVRECDFERTRNPVAVYDQSDTRVVVEDCSFRESAVGVFYSNDFQVEWFEWIGYPETAMCKLLVADSIIRDVSGDLGYTAGVLVEELRRVHTVDARIRDCRIRLEGDGVGIRFLGSQGAVVRDCDFSGPGEAGIYALDAEELRLVGNDFCDLEPSNPEGAAVVVDGTTTIIDKDNDCDDCCTESEQDDD